MTTAHPVTGNCLCGAVRFAARAKSLDVGVCHCAMCRRWASGPMMAVEVVEPPDFAGEENIRVYESSDWGERGFCGRCGTLLFWRMRGGGHYAVSAGALDGPGSLAMTMQIFIDQKPDFYDFANDTPKLTGAEVMALFGGSSGS